MVFSIENEEHVIENNKQLIDYHLIITNFKIH